MTPATPQRRLATGHLNASGVALADILANSVAVLLIMILLMVSIKQQQAETQLEQTVDLSVMMARQLADSVVLDALPNSRPAYLHDYTSCAIPHDCNPFLYPVVEIYDDRVQLFHPPITLTRNQMMQDNSLFDTYLSQLSADALNHIRVDIYGIGMFYLAIATLREYKTPLNHWHFLGEGAKSSRPPAGESANNQLAELLQQGEQGLAGESEASSESDQADGQALPEGTDLADVSQLEGLESESLLPIESLGAEGEQSSENSAQSGDLFEEMLDEFARRRNGDGQQGNPMAQSGEQTFHLRIPNVKPPPDATPIELDLDRDTLEKVLLGFIFAALNDANEQLRFDPERLAQIFANIVSSPANFSAPVSPSLIRDLQQILRAIPSLDEQLVKIDFGQNQRNNNQPVTLQVSPNAAIDQLSLLNADILPSQRELLQYGSASVDLLLRSYPFVYRGERVAISPNMLVLSLPSNLRQRHLHWRPIAIISPDLQNMTLGFAEASYQGGVLELPLEINQVRANKSILQTDFALVVGRNLWQLTIGYAISIVLIGLLLWLLVRWYLRSRY